ncbi:MAG TPA: mandelate racemase/muconate lactonizing enzyme family protein, partial [Phycisphaeraceae bacterium]
NGFTRSTEAAVHELKRFLIGVDPFDTEQIVLHLTRDVYSDGGQIHRCAVAAIEIACLDIKGQALGVPVYQLLGGRVRDRVHAYANGWYRCDRTPEAFAQAAQQVVSRGYRALKFDPFGAAHLAMPKPEEDLSIAIVAAVREAVGPEVELMIEAHCRFSVGSAIKIGRRLEPFGITWYEEPCPHHRIQDTIEVARAVPVPVASGESLHSKEAFLDLISHRVVAVYQPEPLNLGGLTIARQVCAMAEAAGGVVAPHNAQGPISTLACLHLAASCPNLLIQEFFSDFNMPWERRLVDWHPVLDADGMLPLPQRPGLGARLNLDEAARHPARESGLLSLFREGWQRREGEPSSAAD